MFGKNALAPPHYRSDGTLEIKEIFGTLQGEGPFAGQPAVFVRVAGCNLRCWYCDTDFDGGVDLDVEALILDIMPYAYQHHANLVVFTGGEPLRQNIVPVIEALTRRYGMTVQIETAGTIWCDGLEKLIGPLVHIVCSPKTGRLHEKILEHCRDFKYIIRKNSTGTDGLPNEGTQNPGARVKIAKPPQGAAVWIQPMDEHDVEASHANQQAAVEICMRHGYRLSLQVHKIVNLP